MKVSVLFVCLGNICRSPTAHGLFQAYVNDAQLSDDIFVDSAGTGAWHVGESPDKRAQSIALNKGYDISHLSGRQVEPDDFFTFDYILAMDTQNLHDLTSIRPKQSKSRLGLFLELANEGIADKQVLDNTLEVPDPFYGDAEHFEKAIHLIETGAKNLLERIREKYDI